MEICFRKKCNTGHRRLTIPAFDLYSLVAICQPALLTAGHIKQVDGILIKIRALHNNNKNKEKRKEKQKEAKEKQQLETDNKKTNEYESQPATLAGESNLQNAFLVPNAGPNQKAYLPEN